MKNIKDFINESNQPDNFKLFMNEKSVFEKNLSAAEQKIKNLSSELDGIKKEYDEEKTERSKSKLFHHHFLIAQAQAQKAYAESMLKYIDEHIKELKNL